MTDRHIEIHGYHDGHMTWGFSVPLPNPDCAHPISEQLILGGTVKCAVCGLERDVSDYEGVSP